MKKFFAAAIFLVSFAAVAALSAGFATATAEAAVAGRGYVLARGADDPMEELGRDYLSTVYLDKNRLAATSKDVLEYFRNRIYAEHGYAFKTKKWKEEFERYDWYAPNPKFSLESLNEFERKNLWAVVAEEKKRK